MLQKLRYLVNPFYKFLVLFYLPPDIIIYPAQFFDKLLELTLNHLQRFRAVGNWFVSSCDSPQLAVRFLV